MTKYVSKQPDMIEADLITLENLKELESKYSVKFRVVTTVTVATDPDAQYFHTEVRSGSDYILDNGDGTPIIVSNEYMKNHYRGLNNE